MSAVLATQIRKNQIIYMPRVSKNNNLPYHYIINDEYYKVTHATHPTKPGKGGAYITIKAKSILNDNNIVKRLRTEEQLYVIHTHNVKVFFGYSNNQHVIFIDFTGIEYYYPINLINIDEIQSEQSLQLVLTEDNHILGITK